jgi:hypothetical protein
MTAKKLQSPPRKAPRLSRKGTAEIGAEKKFRGQAQSDRQRQRQHDAERADREGLQGKKDRDFQRKS